MLIWSPLRVLFEVFVDCPNVRVEATPFVTYSTWSWIILCLFSPSCARFVTTSNASDRPTTCAQSRIRSPLGERCKNQTRGHMQTQLHARQQRNGGKERERCVCVCACVEREVYQRCGGESERSKDLSAKKADLSVALGILTQERADTELKMTRIARSCVCRGNGQTHLCLEPPVLLVQGVKMCLYCLARLAFTRCCIVGTPEMPTQAYANSYASAS